MRSLKPFFFAAVIASTLTTVGFAQTDDNEPVVKFDFSTAEAVENTEANLDKFRFEPRRGVVPAAISLKLHQQSSPELDGENITGTVSFPFEGEAGHYTIVTEYNDETDGSATYELLVDDEVADSWDADGALFTDILLKRQSEHVQLRPGQTVQLRVQMDGTEYGRVQSIVIYPGEPANEPSAKDLSDQVIDREWSQNLVPLRAYLDLPSDTELIPEPRGLWDDRRGETSYFFLSDANETFTAEVTHGSVHREVRGAWSAYPSADNADEPMAEGRIAAEPGGMDLIEFNVPEAGLHRMVLWTEQVETITHPLTQKMGPDGGGPGYFFVPEGTPAIRLRVSGRGRRPVHVVVKDDHGQIRYRDEMTGDAEKLIAVPADRQQAPWYFYAYGGAAWVEGVPPYVAKNPGDLLVPREAVEGLKERPLASDAEQVRQAKRPVSDQAVAAADAPRVTLARDGRAVATLVAPGGEDDPAYRTATVLRRRLGQIVGHEPALQQAPAAQGPLGPQVWIGTPDDFPDLELPNSFAQLDEQGFMLRTDGDRLLIIGRSHDGVDYGVQTLLMRLGWREYFPGEAWTIVPRSSDVEVALNELQEPSFIIRHISYGRRAGGNLNDEFHDWQNANRLGSRFSSGISHTYDNFVPPDELYEEHPEMFALRDTDDDGIGDDRTWKQPCTTHPESVRLFIEGALEQARKHPEMNLISVSPNDGTGNMCRCERCREVGSYSDCGWLISHQVAEALREEFPDRRIHVGMYAYGATSPPPTLDMPRDEDIVVEVATAFIRGGTTFEQMLAGWPEAVGLVAVRDYFLITSWGDDQPGDWPVAEARDEIRSYHAQGARGLDGESMPGWGGNGLTVYVASRLMWNINADVDAIVDEFYQNCFGTGAEHARSYYERWEQGAELTDQNLYLSLQDLRAGFDAAERDDDKRRFAELALYIHAVKLGRELREMRAALSEDEVSYDEYRNLVLSGDLFYWRTRELGMQVVRAAAWTAGVEGIPWYTLDEVRAMMDQDMQDLQARP